MRISQKPWFLAALLAGFLACMSPASFGEDRTAHGKTETLRDQDEARYLVGRGNIRPLPEVLRALHSRMRGEVLDVQLRLENLHWIYLCKLVTPAGRRLVVPIDAASLAFLEEYPE
jgi:uncharacterized membrane protein YkoI